ncbi:MAG: hypothetical protein KDE01_18175, partial [Caldilineaceae bacterium]|nr:hypothetical protein [Caldilinea sp.]MCB0149558.1 hypothetical protein [Caldilineaceae bacterium]
TKRDGSNRNDYGNRAEYQDKPPLTEHESTPGASQNSSCLGYSAKPVCALLSAPWQIGQAKSRPTNGH